MFNFPFLSHVAALGYQFYESQAHLGTVDTESPFAYLGQGGGLSISGGTVAITACTVSNNTAFSSSVVRFILEISSTTT